MVVGHVPMVHTCSLYVHQSHSCDSTHLFYDLGSTLIIQTAIMQAADGGQLLRHDEIQIWIPQFVKQAPLWP